MSHTAPLRLPTSPGDGAGRTSSTPPRVVVVGGGLAGMTAALRCADAGAEVTLLEKRKRLGGLTWSFSHGGLTMDNGQHVFLRCCTEYLDFLGRIGSAADVEIQDRLDVTVLQPHRASDDPRGSLLAGTNRGRPGRIRSRPLPAPLHLAPALLGYQPLRPADRLRLGPAVRALAGLDLSDPEVDKETFASWLARHGQSARAIEGLWDLICLPTVNLPAREASLAMAAKVFQTGLLSERKAGDIGWSRLPLGRLHGERGAQALQRAGAKVLFDEAVTGVDVTHGGQVSPDAGRFTVRTARGELSADAVVVALPHYCTEQVLPPDALGTARPSELGSSPIVNVHVHFDTPVTSLPLAAGMSSLAQWVFDRTVSSGAERGQYLAVSISAADELIGASPGKLSEAVVEALGELFPRARQARALSTFVTREHHATFRACPGSAVHRAPQATSVPGLAVAGAWTATGWPPTMEGAVRSGSLAARAVLEACGRRRALPFDAPAAPVAAAIRTGGQRLEEMTAL